MNPLIYLLLADRLGLTPSDVDALPDGSVPVLALLLPRP